MNRELVHTIKLDDRDRDYLQFLYVEINSYKEILGYILLEKNKGYEYSIDNYEHFMSEYREANLKYQLAFADVIASYAPEYNGKLEYQAIVNFELCMMEIYKVEKGE